MRNISSGTACKAKRWMTFSSSEQPGWQYPFLAGLRLIFPSPHKQYFLQRTSSRQKGRCISTGLFILRHVSDILPHQKSIFPVTARHGMFTVPLSPVERAV